LAHVVQRWPAREGGAPHGVLEAGEHGGFWGPLPQNPGLNTSPESPLPTPNPGGKQSYNNISPIYTRYQIAALPGGELKAGPARRRAREMATERLAVRAPAGTAA